MRTLNLWFLTSLMLIMTHCDPIVLNEDLPDGSTRLSVSSYFEADSTIKVRVTRGLSVLSNNIIYEGITDATITVLEDGEFLTTLMFTRTPFDHKYDTLSPGWYTSTTVKAKAGKNYEIRVSAPGYESVSAKAYTPPPVQIDRVELPVTPNLDQFYSDLPVDIYFHDPAGAENFYEVYYRIFTRWEDGKTEQYGSELLTNDPAFYYKVDTFDDFLEPPAPLPIFFSDEGINGKLIKVSSTLVLFPSRYPSGEEEEPAVSEYYLLFAVRSLSKDYYQYKTTKILQDKTDGNPFAQPVPVYSNVHNGFGIFAGTTTSVFRYDIE